MEVQPETTLNSTYCQATHLTEFASGMLPPTLNFNSIWAHASFLQNLTIYLTAIVMTTLYAVLMIVSRVLDKLDEKKLGLVKLKSYYHEKYFYEIVVYTGSRADAATDSKVRIFISGYDHHTEAILLYDPHRPAFRRGGIDSFIISTSR